MDPLMQSVEALEAKEVLSKEEIQQLFLWLKQLIKDKERLEGIVTTSVKTELEQFKAMLMSRFAIAFPQLQGFQEHLEKLKKT